MEGGAITSETRQIESAFPSRENYTTVMRGAEVSDYAGQDTYNLYSDAFDMIPKNIFPMWQYESMFQGENPVFVKDALLKGVSGHGAHKDPSHIQKAVAHSLKAFPHLLHMYLNAKNLILPV